MLILERRAGESVELRDRKTGRVLAVIRVLEFLPNDNVRIGFDAAQDIHIVRNNMKRVAPARPPIDGEELLDNRGNR